MSTGWDIDRVATVLLTWNFRFFADHARMSTADTYPMDSGHHAHSWLDPAGVVVAISPWNFPLTMSTWKVAPTLAPGQHGGAQARGGHPGLGDGQPLIHRPDGLVVRVRDVRFGPGWLHSVVTTERASQRVSATAEWP